VKPLLGLGVTGQEGQIVAYAPIHPSISEAHRMKDREGERLTKQRCIYAAHGLTGNST
jgi:hypothetical protein